MTLIDRWAARVRAGWRARQLDRPHAEATRFVTDHGSFSFYGLNHHLLFPGDAEQHLKLLDRQEAFFGKSTSRTEAREKTTWAINNLSPYLKTLPITRKGKQALRHKLVAVGAKETDWWRIAMVALAIQKIEGEFKAAPFHPIPEAVLTDPMVGTLPTATLGTLRVRTEPARGVFHLLIELPPGSQSEGNASTLFEEMGRASGRTLAPTRPDPRQALWYCSDLAGRLVDRAPYSERECPPSLSVSSLRDDTLENPGVFYETLQKMGIQLSPAGSSGDEFVREK